MVLPRGKPADGTAIFAGGDCGHDRIRFVGIWDFRGWFFRAIAGWWYAGASLADCDAVRQCRAFHWSASVGIAIILLRGADVGGA